MSRKKKPYTPPTIRTEKVYERRSLACGKILPARGGSKFPKSCLGNFRNS